ncbi:hypothetical protein ccbrp13_40340 [Ktedonobacteria bacterium brp13]|nr:hypothetical protein ccbrp13_40340 [Ktedonobacteria bacterium brp13]
MLKKRLIEQNINNVVQQHIANIESIAQQHDTEIRDITQKQKEDLIHNQENIIEQTKTEIDQIILVKLQAEKDRMERVIREQEIIRPAREAASTAIEHIAVLKQKARNHKQLKNGLVGGFGVVAFVALVISLILLPLQQWVIIMALAALALIFNTALFWRSNITEDKIVEGKRQIAFFQTKSGEYAPLNEEERCALLVQKILK